MKKILNFSRVAVALLCFMLIGLTTSKAAIITFAPGTDIDPTTATIDVCANSTVVINAALGGETINHWEFSDNGGITFGVFGSMANPFSDLLNPKPGAPLCRQYRLVTDLFIGQSFSNIITACAKPTMGPLTITAPTDKCQDDAILSTITASATNAVSISITKFSPPAGGTFQTADVFSGNLTDTRTFQHGPAYSGPVVFQATANGCLATGLFGTSAAMQATINVHAAITPGSITIVSSTGLNDVCEGDVVTYTASQTNAFGVGPLFSFQLSNAAAGTQAGEVLGITNGTTISPISSSDVITFNTAYPPAGPNPVQLSVSVKGCLNPAGGGNGVLGMDAVTLFPITIRQLPIITALTTSGANPSCPGVCRPLTLTFDNTNGFSGVKTVVLSSSTGPNITVTVPSMANSYDVPGQACPTATTTYTVLSVTAAGVNNTCAGTQGVGLAVTLNVTPNTAITSLLASASPVCLGTNITLTATAVGGSLTYCWRKIGGVGSSPAVLQGPNGTNTFVVLGNSVNNSGTYQVEVKGACGVSVFAQVSVSIVAPAIAGVITPSVTNLCGAAPVTLTLTGNTGAVVRWESQTNCAGPWNLEQLGGTTLTVVPPAGTTCYRAVIQNSPCLPLLIFSNTVTINVDLPAVGGIVTLNNNFNTSVTLCGPAAQAILRVRNFTGKVQKWQYSNANTGIWLDIPLTAGQTTITVNGSTVNQTVFFRACICTKLGICTGPSAIAYSASFKVVKKAVCPGPDGSILNEDLPEAKATITKAYPTPTTHRVTLDIDGAAEGTATIEVFDLIGRSVKMQKSELLPGNNQVSVDISELASGIYIVRFTDKENHRASMKITRQ